MEFLLSFVPAFLIPERLSFVKYIRNVSLIALFVRSDAKNCLKKRLMETVTAQKQKEQSSRNIFFF